MLKKKILLVDDHPLIRKGIALTLEAEPTFEICCQVSSGEEALEMLSRIEADAAIVDVSLPGMNGIELIKHMKTAKPDLKILVVSRHDEEVYAERAIRSGANGYIMKQEAGEVLINGVKKILAGGVFVSQAINERMLQNMLNNKGTSEQSPFELLSDRELEVFEHIGRGVVTKDIAEKMHVSVKTIETYKARMKEKLGFETSLELTRSAIQWVQES
jgi:DNA-binding NarL/FixJ family response regulator